MHLNYKISGSGPPIIFLHGLFGMLDNWRTIARALEIRYQCILVDLRNHGRSPRSDEMNYNVMSDDVLKLMDDLKLESAIILGHSMGGKVAMELALKFPERISKLIVVDISPRAYPPHHADVIGAIESIDPSALENRSDAENKFRSHL